jgi:predicted dehydrogenase
MRRDPTISGRQALKLQALIDALLQSAADGRVVAVGVDG